MKKTVITLAFIACSITPLFAQLYYPTSGSGSGAVPPTGIANTFFGNYTGNLTSTGLRNSFFGHYTGAFNTSGEQNTFIGCLAGYNNSTGSFNTFLGERAGGSNTTASGNTFVGSLTGTSSTTGANNTFTGFKAGYVNTSSSNSFYGFESGVANTSGSSNSFYGFRSGAANQSAGSNSFYGYESGLTNSSGNRNSFFGNQSGRVNTTGSANSFFGNECGKANTTGSSNSFLGVYAGLDNTTGSDNTFMGLASGQRNTTASYNSFYGSGSGITNTTGADNSFFGNGAGFSNTTGQSNIFMGSGTATYNVSGSENTYVGTRSGVTALGSGNSTLGFRATPANNVNNSTAIGRYAYVSTDHTIVLGDVSSPITVLIGKTAKTGTYSLETNGDIYINSTFYPSDKQYKKDIETYTNAMDVINKLQPVKYFFKDDVYFPEAGADGKPVKRNFDKEEQIGFIAQELEQVLPNMVRTDKNGFKAVNYTQLFGVLTQGMKEQDVKINSLETQNKELMEKLDAVNALLSSQKPNSNIADAATTVDAAKIKMNGAISSVSPNPFSSSTTINYIIPENYKQANLSVVSESGIQSANVSIRESGKGFFVFAGETLKPGSYYCYLTVNGVIVDYQKIVLVK